MLASYFSVSKEALKKPIQLGFLNADCVTKHYGQHFLFEGICMQTARTAEWVVYEIRQSYGEPDLILSVLKMSYQFVTHTVTQCCLIYIHTHCGPSTKSLKLIKMKVRQHVLCTKLS